MHPVDAILSNRRREPSMAQVVSTAPADGACTVLLADGEVDARLSDHMLLPGPSAAVVAGDVVALLPIGDTYLVVGSVGSSAGAGGTAPSLGPNLLPNPGFEFGGATPDHWAAWPWRSDEATWGRDVTPGESVSGSARVVQNLPAGSGLFISTWTLNPLLVDPGKTYRVSAWVKASILTADLTCTVRVYTGADADAAQPAFGAGGTLLDAATLVSPGSAYQLMFGDVTIPAGHDVARVYLRADSNHPSPLAVSWDEAAFQQRITS